MQLVSPHETVRAFPIILLVTLAGATCVVSRAVILVSSHNIWFLGAIKVLIVVVIDVRHQFTNVVESKIG